MTAATAGRMGCQTVAKFSREKDGMWPKRVSSFSSAGHKNESTNQGSNPACRSLCFYRRWLLFIPRKALGQFTGLRLWALHIQAKQNGQLP